MKSMILLFSLAAGCSELAKYEAPDGRDGGADGVAADGGNDATDAADVADVAVDAGTDAPATDTPVADVVADDGTDAGTDAGVDVAEEDGGAVTDDGMCPSDMLRCSVGGPCVSPGTTDQACGVCPSRACGAGFSCMNPGGVVLNTQCCHTVDQSQSCGSQCAAPAGCLTTPSGTSFCCENN